MELENLDTEQAETGVYPSLSDDVTAFYDNLQDVISVGELGHLVLEHEVAGPSDEVGPVQVVGEAWTDVGLGGGLGGGLGLIQDTALNEGDADRKSISTSPIVSRKARHFAQSSPSQSVSLMTGIFDDVCDSKHVTLNNGHGVPEKDKKDKKDHEWTCPVHGNECGDKCTAEEFLYKKHEWTFWKCILGIPFRISYFFVRKVVLIKNWIQPPELFDPTTRRDPASQPFLELKVTFTPSRELAILYYFQALSAQKRLGVQVEFDKMDEFLENGANINAKDRQGKTVLHAACREEGLEVIRYLIEKGSAINTMDKYGRTPLHMAAAMENHTTISYLIECKADYGAMTHGDIQTPLHYASKNDAPLSCKILVEHGAKLEARDYRGRTPLLLAAELDRSVAASALLDCGASVKILDYTGYHPVCAMIKNMPDIAVKGLNQFYKINKTSRQEFFWLNYLEPRLISSEGISFPSPSVLEEVVKTKNQDLIKHPVMKEIISVKWSQFGIFNCIYELLLYFFTIFVWSLMVILKPFDQEFVETAHLYLYVIEALGVILFTYQVVEEVIETWEGFKAHRDWKNWKLQQIRADFDNVLPDNIEERIYLEEMEAEVRSTKSPYWADAWNTFDWALLVLLSISFLLYSIDTFSHKESQEWPLGLWKSIFFTISLTAAWVKMFKYVKVFETMGPFVVIVSNSVADIVKILFVFVILYVPTACIFYQFYGKSGITAYSGEANVFFTVFRMVVVDDYAYQELIDWGGNNGIETAWTHFLIAYWLLASAIILLNLFIALMSDTFQRIFDKAIEVAALERAETIVGLEKKLSYNRRDQFLKYIKRNFAPKISMIENDIADDQVKDKNEGKLPSRAVAKTIVDQVKELSEEVLDTSADDATDYQTEIKMTFEEQEIALRNAFNKLSVITAKKYMINI